MSNYKRLTDKEMFLVQVIEDLFNSIEQKDAEELGRDLLDRIRQVQIMSFRERLPHDGIVKELVDCLEELLLELEGNGNGDSFGILATTPQELNYVVNTFELRERAWTAIAKAKEHGPNLLNKLEEIEKQLAFHEGSEKPKIAGGEPVVWINGDDFNNLLSDIRAAIAKAKGE